MTSPNSDNQPQSVQNPELLDAVRAIAHDDNPDTRRAMYNALLGSTLLVPAREEPANQAPSGWATLQQDAGLPLLSLTNSQGQVALPVFTDEGALSAWRPEGGPYVGFRARDLFKIAQQNNTEAILLNPAGPAGGEITRREIVALAQGAIPEGDNRMVIPEDTRALIGQPANPPSPEFMARLKEAMQAYPEIEAGYLVLMAIGQGEPHLVAGVLFRQQPNDEAIGAMMQDLGSKAGPALEQGEYLDFVVLGDNDFSRTIERNGIAVYRAQ